jgi:SSS family solute:Na+ symporter
LLSIGSFSATVYVGIIALVANIAVAVLVNLVVPKRSAVVPAASR